MLIDAAAAQTAALKVFPSMFTDPDHSTFFNAAKALLERGIRVDPATIIDQLAGVPIRTDGGAHAFCADLLDAVPTAANIEYHIRMVREAYIARRRPEIFAQAANAFESGLLSVSEIEAAVQRELAALRELEDADRPRRFLTLDELIAIPKPDFIIDEILVRNSLAVLVGAPGCGKSLIALGWAMCMGAGGFRWAGREVVGGPVVYIAAEGSQGMGARVKAWQTHHGIGNRAHVHTLTTTVPLLDVAETDQLIADIKREVGDPLMIVIDTLSRSMAGGDENSQAEMSTLVANVDRIRESTLATALLLHHTNAAGERERGSTVLRGAADTLMIVRKDEDGLISVACEKQKDSNPFAKITMSLSRVDESVVLGHTDGVRPSPQGLTPSATEILLGLYEGHTSAGATSSDWMALFPKMQKGVFHRARKLLVEGSYVDGDPGKRGARYTVNDKGYGALVALGHIKVTVTETVKVSPNPGGLEAPGSVTNGVDDDYERWEEERTTTSNPHRQVEGIA